MLTFSNRDLRAKVKEDLGQDTGEFDYLYGAPPHQLESPKEVLCDTS